MSIVPNPNADFSPAGGVYTELKPFRFWCQKVLPLVYDDSLSYYELLCKVVDYLNKTMEDVDNAVTEVQALHAAYDLLEGYVNDYFDTLDVQQEINNKLDAMAQSGALSDLISPFVENWLPGIVEEQIPGVVGEQIGGTVAEQIGGTVAQQIGGTVAGQISPVVADWLEDNITPTTPAVDTSLTVAGAAADAKATGDAIGKLNSDVGQLSYTWVDGKSIRSNGEEYASENYSYAVVSVYPGGNITGYTHAGKEATKAIAFYTADNVFISSDYNSSGSDYNWNYSLTVPENARIAKLSCATSYKNDFTIFRTNIANEVVLNSNNIEKLNVSVNEGTTSIKGTLKFATGVEKIDGFLSGYIVTNVDPVDITDIRSSATAKYKVVDCEYEDIFTITANGGTSYYAWTFINSSNGIVSSSGSNANVVNKVITAPLNATKLIIQTRNTPECYKGYSLNEAIDNINDNINENDAKYNAHIFNVARGTEYYDSLNRRKNQLKGEDNGVHWYGAEWYENDSENTSVNGIYSDGDAELLQALPIQSSMRRCVVKDGVLMYYLDSNNSAYKENGSNANLDGTDGDVCVEIPEFWFKFEITNVDGKRKVALKLSENYIPGFSYSPKMYTGAYEATINRSVNKLCSVCTTNYNYTNETIYMTDKYLDNPNGSVIVNNATVCEVTGYTPNASTYRGCDNNSTYDSITDTSNDNYWRNNLGRPIAKLSKVELKKLADPNTGKFIYLYDIHKALWMLSMVEYRNKNIQSGSAMGKGAVVMPSYDAFKQWCIDDTESILPCGITNVLGNGSGTVWIKVRVPVSVTGSYPNADPDTFVYGYVWIPCISYRGVEHYWGHIYKTLDQIAIKLAPTYTYDPDVDNKQIMDVYYYYSNNPYMCDELSGELPLIDIEHFAPPIVNTLSYIFGDNGHILPTASCDYEYNDPKSYCDCTEFNRNSVIDWYQIDTNGSLINNNLPGRNMLVGAFDPEGIKKAPRNSNGTRISYVNVVKF